MALRSLLLGCLLTCCFSFSALAQDFNQAKRQGVTLYRDHPVTFYCGCTIRYEGKRMLPDWESCGYVPRKQPKRAARIEWEHIMPAWEFGHQRQCWQQGGRKNCAKSDEGFRQMEGDLHNLVPAIGEVNGDRANYRFQQWNGVAGQYGACPMVVDFAKRRAQPPEASRGAIARAYLYMAQRYDLRIAEQQLKLFNAWNKQYPADAWECQRNRRIAQLQGQVNPFITEQCP